MAVRMLLLHARLNQVSDRLQVIHAAAAAQPGWKRMLPVGVIGDGFYVEPHAGRPASDLIRVRAVTVDGLAGELGIAPTHLKIDVEGAEEDVLRGAGRTLSGDHPPLVFLELHNIIIRRSGRDPSDPLRQLEELGYRIEASDGTPLNTGRATGPDVIRLVARRPTLQFPTP